MFLNEFVFVERHKLAIFYDHLSTHNCVINSDGCTENYCRNGIMYASSKFQFI